MNIKGTINADGALKGNVNAVSGYDGKSAYEIAVKNGFEGTEEEWLKSLSGVYVGSGDMPDNCNVQIDPNGDVIEADVFSKVSNALKGNPSGKVVAIKDVSPIQHDVKVKATPVVVAETDLSAGGSITFDPISNWVITTSAMLEYLQFTLEDGGKLYTPVSPNELGAGAKYFKVECVGGVCTYYYYDDEAMTSLYHTEEVEMSSPLVGVATDDAIHVKVEVALADSVNIKVCGKNLLPNIFKGINKVHQGVTFVENGDGTVTANGTSTHSGASYVFADPNLLLKAGTYTLSGVKGGGSATWRIRMMIDNKNNSTGVPVIDAYGSNTVEFYQDTVITRVLLTVAYNATADNVVFKPQIEVGSVATDYEPYREPVTYTPNADGELSLASVYPSMTFAPETDGVELSVEYNKDLNKAIAEIQNVIAQLQTLAVATVPMNEEL